MKKYCCVAIVIISSMLFTDTFAERVLNNFVTELINAKSYVSIPPAGYNRIKL